MRIDVFISRRLALSKQKSFSKLIIRLSVLAVTLSVAVMIIASSLVEGFRDSITQKIFGFWGHVNVSEMTFSNSYDDQPILIDQEFYIHY